MAMKSPQISVNNERKSNSGGRRKEALGEEEGDCRAGGGERSKRRCSLTLLMIVDQTL
jgi:hypothetical protein